MFTFQTGTDKPFMLVGLEIVQTTEIADAADEIIGLGVYRTVTGGSPGSALTEVALDSQDGTTAGVAVAGQASVTSTAGTLVCSIGWHLQSPGTVWQPIPLLRPTFPGNVSANHAIRLLNAPIDSVTYNATLLWAEAQEGGYLAC